MLQNRLGKIKINELLTLLAIFYNRPIDLQYFTSTCLCYQILSK